MNFVVGGNTFFEILQWAFLIGGNIAIGLHLAEKIKALTVK